MKSKFNLNCSSNAKTVVVFILGNMDGISLWKVLMDYQGFNSGAEGMDKNDGPTKGKVQLTVSTSNADRLQ